MAGWRKQVGNGEDPEPIELLDGGDSAAPEPGGHATVDWHARLRTGAAVVAALALLWMGWSYAQQAAAGRDQSCVNDVQQAYWRYEQMGYGPGGPSDLDQVFTDEVIDDLIARARECGAGTYADALDRTRPTADDE